MTIKTTPRFFPFSPVARSLLAAFGVSAAVLAARGADLQKADNDAPLSAAESWAGDVLPGAQDRALFGPGLTGDHATPLDTDTAWAGIVLSGGTPSWTISGPAQLALGASGIALGADAGNLVLAESLRLLLAGAQTWSVASNRDLAVAAPISGAPSAALTKSGEGTLTLTGNNTFAGGTVLGNGNANNSSGGTATPGTGGTVVLGHGGALGTGAVTAKGAQLWAAAADITLTNTVSIDLGGVRFGGTNDLTLTGPATVTGGDRGFGNYSRSQTIRLNGPLALGTRKLTLSGVDNAAVNGTSEFNGPITGSGSLTIDSSYDNGIVIVSSDNSGYTGSTAINSGALRIGHTHALGRTGSITLGNSGARLELSDGLIFTRPITVSDFGNAKGLRLPDEARGAEFAGPIIVSETAAGNFEITAKAGQVVTLSGAITSASGAGVEKLGEGTLHIPNANAFTDPFFLGNGTANQSGKGTASAGSGGTVLIGHGTALGLGVVSARGAQLQAAVDGIVVPNTITLDSGAFRFSGDHDLTLSGTITNSASTRSIANYSGARQLTLTGPLVALEGYDISFSANNNAATNGTTAVLGPISGGGNLAVDPSYDYGTVVFAGNNSYTGKTSVSSGTLRLDYSAQDNSKLADNAALALSGATVELAGGTHTERVAATSVSGAAAIRRSGGTAVLALGALAVSGSLHLAAEDIASTTSENVNGVLPGVTVQADGRTRWAARSNVPDGGDGYLIRAYAGTPSDIPRLGGILPDDATLHARIVNGGETSDITLSSTSNEVDTLTIEADEGPAVIALPDSILNLSGIALAPAAAPAAVGSLAEQGYLTAGGEDAGLPATLVLANDSDTSALTINANITNNGTEAVGLLTRGGGTVILASTNLYTGGTVIESGTLQVGNGGTSGQLGTGGVQLNGLLTFARGAGSPDLAVGPAILGPGSVVQNGATGTRVMLRGSTSGYAGGTTVSSGILRAEDASADDQLLQLGTGPVTLIGGKLEIRSNGAGDAGVIVTGDGLKGNDVIVSGNATLDVARYSGTTRVNNTILFGALAISETTLTFAGVNKYRASFASAVTLRGNVTLNPTSNDADVWLSLDGPITDEGRGNSLTKTGIGTLVLNGDNAFSGDAIIGNTTANSAAASNSTATANSGGYVALGHDHALGTGTVYARGAQFKASRPNVVIPNTVVATNGGFRFGGTVDLAFSGALIPVGASRGIGNYSLDKTLTLGDIHLEGQSVTFEALPGSLTNGTILVRGAISNSKASGAPTVKSSFANGRVVFAGSNTYATATTIEAGAALQLGAGGTSGSLNPLSTIANSGTLAFNRSDTVRQGVDFNGLLSGAGGISQEGLGAVILTNANTYTGPTRIRAGATLQLGDGRASGSLSPASAITDDGTLTFDRANAVVQGTHFAPAIRGAGGLVQAGPGTLTLNGANTYAGPTEVRSGTLVLTADQSAATGAVSVAAGATLAGNGVSGGLLSVASGGILAPGGAGEAGLLSVGTLTLQSGAVYRWDVSPATNDIVHATGDLTLPDTFTVDVRRLAPGSIRSRVLFRYGGTYLGPSKVSITTTGQSSVEAAAIIDDANKQVLIEVLRTGTIIKLR